MPEFSVRDLTPEEVAQGLKTGRMVLVDVREPNETEVERYPDAVIVPLSAFDPAAIPEPQGREVVFACRSGRRSVTASLAAQEQGYPYNCAPRRRHIGVEGRRAADRILMPFCGPRCYGQRHGRVVSLRYPGQADAIYLPQAGQGPTGRNE